MFLGINYTSSLISQPLSTWDAPDSVPLNLPLLSLNLLPLLLHSLSIFFLFSSLFFLLS